MLEHKQPILSEKLKFTLTPVQPPALNLRLTLSQQAPSSTNSHQNSNTRDIFSPQDQQSAETTEADWRCRDAGEGERSPERRGRRRVARESERKGQTPQQ